MVKKHSRLLVIIFPVLAGALCLGYALASRLPSWLPSQEDRVVFAPEAAAQANWTLLFYLCGTDLETDHGAATANLFELLELPPNQNYQVLVQTGGARAWQNDAVDPGYLERWLLQDRRLTLVEQLPLANMGDAGTLGDFLSWGVANFPAEHYGLVLWDHGGGAVKGLVYDQLFAYDCLSLAELTTGLSRAGEVFELIGLDACMMATLETAAALTPYARYLVASQEYEPAHGWDYGVWPALLETAENGLAVGRGICDSYYDKCVAQGNGAMATLSVVDLSLIPPLVSAFQAMAAEMTGVTGDIDLRREFTQGAARTENYGGNNDQEGYANMVDLGDLTVNTVSVLTHTADRLLERLFDAVKYEVHGKSRSMANGLSVYYPLDISAGDLFSYADVAVSSRYVGFLGQLTNKPVPEWVDREAPTGEALREEDYAVVLDTLINSEGYYELRVSEGLESVASVQFRLYYVDGDYQEYVLLGYDNDLDSAYGEEGVFLDNFRGVWPTLNGCYCAPQLIAEEKGYNLYAVPILLNGAEMFLRAAWIWDRDGEGHYEVYGAWSGVDDLTGLSARDIRQPRQGDRVELLFQAEDWETGKTTAYSLGGFTVQDGLVLAESSLADGDYLYQFVVTDVFGRDYVSQPVRMTVADDRISLYETGDAYGGQPARPGAKPENPW